MDELLDLKMSRRKQQNPKHHSKPGKSADVKAEEPVPHSEMTSAEDQRTIGLSMIKSSISCPVPQSISCDTAKPLAFLALQQQGVASPTFLVSVLSPPAAHATEKLAGGAKNRTKSSKSDARSIPPAFHEDRQVTDKTEPTKQCRRYQCDACGRLLSTSTSLERHMLTHTGQRPFPCPSCPICFTTNGNLLRHIKSCHEQGPTQESVLSPLSPFSESPAASLVAAQETRSTSVALNFSQYSNSTSGTFGGHSRDSMEEEMMGQEAGHRAGSNGSEGDGTDDLSKYKPFLCTLCDKVFSTRTNCERHIRNRHSEKSYSRQELVKLIKFIPKDAAESHAICKYCKKDYVSVKMLKHHLRSPYSSCRRKPFACQLCEATFSTRNNCIRHISNLHPERKFEYKKLVILNAPIPPDDDFGDIGDDDMSPPTMAVLSPGVLSYSGRDSLEDIDRDSLDRDDSISDTYSPENYTTFSPERDRSVHRVVVVVDNPLDLTMGPLDLSVKKRGPSEEVRSSPTSWFSKSRLHVPSTGNNKCKKTPLVSVASLMERAVPLRTTTNANVLANRPPPAERPAKRPRPYICPYCGIGFTIRGNMYRHFRHKHPEHVSKRRQKKAITQLTESSAKQIDDILDSVVSVTDSAPTDKIPSLSHPIGAIAHQDHSDADEEMLDSHSLKEESVDEDDEEHGELRIDESHNNDEFHDERGMSVDGISNGSDGRQKINSYSMSPHVHACNECGRKFPWQSSLERHMYTHTGQKPYSCRWCPLKFSIKSNCERHCLRIHGKSFNNARKEKRNHGKPFKCPVCGDTFSFKINCERHCLDTHKQHYEVIMGESAEQAAATPVTSNTSVGIVKKKKKAQKASPASVRPSFYYQCLNCDISFPTKKDLELHEENNHPSDVDEDGSNSSFSGSIVVDA